MIARAVLSAIALVGCAARPGPVVSVVFDQSGVPADRLAYVRAGASAWTDLEIGYAEIATEPACPERWFDPGATLPCAIEVHVTFLPGSELGGAGLTANRRTMLQLELTGDQLAATAAHEIGHSLWGPGHVPVPAIMSSPATSLLPTAADRHHARETSNGWSHE